MSSPPVWSIGTGKRDTSSKSILNQSPGPGSYTYDNLRRTKTPSWKMGTASRGKEIRNETPGPGSYGSTEKLTKNWPKFSFASKTALKERDSTPGPGSYSSFLEASQKKGPSYTLRLKTSSIVERTESPGPAAYEQSSLILNQRHATHKIGTANRDQLHHSQENPGPGHYFKKLAGFLESGGSLKHKFGSAERSLLDTSKSLPGPGSYNLNRTFDSNAGGVSILSKRRESDLNGATRLPGPGSYEPSLLFKKKAPAYRLGSAPRSQAIKDQMLVPGPGEYNPDQIKRSIKVRIGTALRKSLAEKTATPGPGAYEQDNSVSKGPTHVIVPKRDDVSQTQKDRDTPGPGAYSPDVKLVRSRNPKYSVGNAKRDPNSSLEAVPGPGTYNSAVDGLGPRWTFGSELRGESLNQSPEPGPGSYNIPAKFNNIPNYARPSSSLKNSFYQQS